jgi:hypothetical protein
MAGRGLKVLSVHITFHNYFYALDGGTTWLRGSDESGNNHIVMLVQHAHPQPSDSLDGIPGRVYWNGELVPIRSPREIDLLRFLRNARVAYLPTPEEQCGTPIELAPNALILGEDIRQLLHGRPEENLRSLLLQVVEFVESEQYVLFAQAVEQSADGERYDVYVVAEVSRRKEAIARLSGLMRIGVKAARDLLDQGLPVAKDMTALEVARLASQLHSAGLSVKVKPEYRWRIQ